MAAKAFVMLTSVSAAGDGTSNGVVIGTYVLLAEDSSVINDNNCSIVFDHGATAFGIREALADNIRDNNEDPAIEVVFIESG